MYNNSNKGKGQGKGGEKRDTQVVGDLLKGVARDNGREYEYINVNVYCGKDDNGQALVGELIASVVVNGEKEYYKINKLFIRRQADEKYEWKLGRVYFNKDGKSGNKITS